MSEGATIQLPKVVSAAELGGCPRRPATRGGGCTTSTAWIMLVPTVGFDWITDDRDTAAPGESECMLVLPADSDDDVDAIIERARRAGADIVTEPGQQRWGCAGGFADLDGHLRMVRTGLQSAE